MPVEPLPGGLLQPGSMDVRTVSLGPPEAFCHSWPIFDPPLLCPHVVQRLESHERPIKLVRPNHFDAKICTGVVWAAGAERFNRRQEVGKGPVLPMFGKLERAKGIEPSYAAWEAVTAGKLSLTGDSRPMPGGPLSSRGSSKDPSRMLEVQSIFQGFELQPAV